MRLRKLSIVLSLLASLIMLSSCALAVNSLTNSGEIRSLSFEYSSKTVYMGETFYNNLQYSPSDFDHNHKYEFVWSTSEKSVCQVEEIRGEGARFYAGAPGTATITVKSKKNSFISASFEVEVKKPKHVFKMSSGTTKKTITFDENDNTFIWSEIDNEQNFEYKGKYKVEEVSGGKKIYVLTQLNSVRYQSDLQQLLYIELDYPMYFDEINNRLYTGALRKVYDGPYNYFTLKRFFAIFNETKEHLVSVATRTWTYKTNTNKYQFEYTVRYKFHGETDNNESDTYDFTWEKTSTGYAITEDGETYYYTDYGNFIVNESSSYFTKD